jgi:hypothetical protein
VDLIIKDKKVLFSSKVYPDLITVNSRRKNIGEKEAFTLHLALLQVWQAKLSGLSGGGIWGMLEAVLPSDASKPASLHIISPKARLRPNIACAYFVFQAGPWHLYHPAKGNLPLYVPTSPY